MKRVLAVLTVFLSCSVFAQDEKEQLMAELMVVLDAKALPQELFDTMLHGLSEGQGAETVERYRHVDYVEYGEQVYAPLFARHFNADELRALIAFLKTKPGQKLAAVLPELGMTGMMRGANVLEEAVHNIEKEKQKENPWRKAMAEIRLLESHLMAYASDGNSYPDVDLDALEKLLVPTYTAKVQKLDPWGTPYLYLGKTDQYRIVSAGADRRFDQSSWKFEKVEEGKSPTARTSDSLDADIVLQNGSFTQFPQGAEQEQ